MQYQRGDIVFKARNIPAYDDDRLKGRAFPDSYAFLEFTVHARDASIDPALAYHPWEVLESGFRTILPKGHPHLVENLRELEKYFPMHVELGCGPSIEAGVPPLHFLHEVYSVSDHRTGTFILDPQKDKIIKDVLSDPENFYRRASLLYAQALVTPPTDFYKLLKDMHHHSMIIEPIITNNFDGFAAAVGLSERYIRQYTTTRLVPKIDFRPDARSLLVVGAHADRRRVAEAARDQGLKVIYIDPEGYWEHGKFRSYPLEAPQDSDMLIRTTASKFSSLFRKIYNI